MIDLPPEAVELLAQRTLRIAGGLFLVAMAAWLAVLDRRSAGARAFAVLLVAYGLGIVENAVDDPLGPVVGWTPFNVLQGVLVAIVFGATVRFLSVFPRAAGPFAGRGASRGLLIATIVLAIVLAVEAAVAPAIASAGISGLPSIGYVVDLFPIEAASAAVLANAWRRQADPVARRSTLVVAAGFVLLAGYGLMSLGGVVVFSLTGDLEAPPPVYLALAAVAAVCAWGLLALVAGRAWSAHRSDPSSNARLLLLALGGGVLAGSVFRIAGGGAGLLSNSASGVVQIAFPLLVAYGILRHSLFGIEVKLRWTISRSTVAAAFVAVFFVASEGAQLLFGAENQVVGLVAAGALVFAIAPLQRAADRLAERAVPVALPTPAPSGPRSVDAYRIALRRFLADGRISVEEELALARIATHERLTPEEALRVRHEVEAELGRRAA